MDRLFDALSEILDFAEDRVMAWAVAAGAALATVASWWFALSRSTSALLSGIPENASLTGADRLLATVAVFAPFVLVNAVWQAVAPTADTAKAREDYSPLSGHHDLEISDMRRRRLLGGVLVGLLNGFVMYIVTH